MMRVKLKKTGLMLLAVFVALSCAVFSGCNRSVKYADALKIGSTEIPKTLMPYLSTAPVNTYVAGLLYDTLLQSVSVPEGYEAGEEYLFPDGTEYAPVDESENYFKLTGRLCETAGAYPRRAGSKYGWVTFEPTAEEYQSQLARKNIVKGQDEAGNPLTETDEEFALRSEAAVPAHNWMEYRFKVRGGYTWSDGAPFSAKDIEFTFQYALKHAGALASIAYFLNNYFDCYAEKSGDFLLKLATNKTGDIKAITSSVPILPEHIWSEIRMPAQQKNLNPVGTGAYTVQEGDYIEDSSLTLTYREDYSEKLKNEMFANAPIRHLSIIRMSNTDVMLSAVQRGDLDVSLDEIDSTKAYALKNNTGYDNVKLTSGDSDFVTTLVCNVGEKGAFRNDRLNGHAQKVRRAISLAIDQNALIADVLHGEGTSVGDGLVQRFEPHALVNGDGSYAEHKTDIQQAKTLLNDAGYPVDAFGKRDLAFQILSSAGNETLINAIGTQLAASLGITVTYKQADSRYSEVIKQRNGADFDMIINTVTFAADKLIMFDARYGVYPNGAIRVWNVSGVNDAALSKLIYQMDLETDILKQYELARAVQERLALLTVEIPLYCGKNHIAYSEKQFSGWIEAAGGSVLNSYSMRYLQKI